MGKHLFILLFTTGLVSLVWCVPHKYYLIQQGKTWREAQAYCQAINTYMAVIKSNEDMIQLQKETQRQQFISSAWIGLYNDINSWRWSFGNEKMVYMGTWCSQQPDNWKGVESCCMTSLCGWNDAPCTNVLPFVCFDGSKTGSSRYIYISNPMSWAGAQSYCRQYYTDLASARNNTEDLNIKRLIHGDTWFGLFRDAWKWIDQTTTTISWKTGKPDNALGNENCAYINNNQVADARCSDIMPFFCYSIKRQIIRVKVISNQDMNDPATMVDILEKVVMPTDDITPIHCLRLHTWFRASHVEMFP